MGGQCHTPAALPPRKTRYPLYRRLGWSQGRSGRKTSSLPGFDPWTVQPVASRYTDWAIPGHIHTFTVWFLIKVELLLLLLLLLLIIENFRTVGSAVDCTAPRSGMDSIKGWFPANRLKLKSDRTTVITFARRLKQLTIYTITLRNFVVPMRSVW